MFIFDVFYAYSFSLSCFIYVAVSAHHTLGIKYSENAHFHLQHPNAYSIAYDSLLYPNAYSIAYASLLYPNAYSIAYASLLYPDAYFIAKACLM